MRSYAIAILILAGGGALLSSFQGEVLTEEKERGLLPSPLLQYHGEGEVKKLEQQLFFVSLGGLRSLVAAFLSVNAYDYFARRDWGRLADRYHQVVALAPHNAFYWENGSWHMAYNATSDSLNDRSLRETERRIRFRKYLDMGRNFLREGIRNNPDDWFLYTRLGDTLSDRFRSPDYAAAAEAYQMAIQKGATSQTVRSLLYCLAQVPGKERNAYALARELLKNGHKVPTVECLTYAYQISLNVPRDKRLSIREIFSSPRSADSELSKYIEMEVQFPKEGLRDVLRILAPYKKCASWSAMSYSDLDKVSYYDTKTKHTLP